MNCIWIAEENAMFSRNPFAFANNVIIFSLTAKVLKTEMEFINGHKRKQFYL